jgi:hypothetical protein
MLPTARRENLTVNELPDETVVYDHQRNKAHCLNRTSVLVWKLCDGKTSIARIAAEVERQLQIPRALEMVHLALEQLSKRHLLVQPVEPVSDQARASRREILKTLAKGLAVAAVALPVVMTMRAPTARAQATLCFIQCPSGLPLPNTRPCSVTRVCNALCNPTGNLPAQGICVLPFAKGD